MLDEIAELLAEEDPGDIILFSTDDGVVNEDSGDGNEANILHIASRMLRPQVELQNRPSTSGENCMDDMKEEEEINVPAPKKKKIKDNTIKKLYSNVTNTSFTNCTQKSTALNEDADIVTDALEKCVPNAILVCILSVGTAFTINNCYIFSYM
ncbi:hypothetical protein EVAR_76141_1 [Eumeta japonica]|uniref:Uncharacterized protein n=1 Tax=Eumeta variegata TaxID=151549 RepID=A0A4C1UVY6_EUMVA|nr:hypothetical protein EVAR_76141_1 [Eumeta japonica]